MKALVVDHLPDHREYLRKQIERLGIAVVGVASGTAALKCLLAEEPDFILLDSEVPDVDGFDLARRLRALEGPVEWRPIVFLTSPRRENDLARGLAGGGDDYLFLPVSEAVLSAKIRALQRMIQMRYSLLAMTRQLDHANEELRRLSAIDGLTGIANRRHFDATLAREWRRSMRQGSELSLLMCDVDHFKKYNDSNGHQAGDDCLRRVAGLIEAAVERGGDIAARYGGEEFALILPETGLAGAVRLAQGLLDKIAAEHLPHPDAPLGRVSLSIGVAAAVAMPETTSDSLLRAADRALYQAKAGGRNRVSIAPPLDAVDCA